MPVRVRPATAADVAPWTRLRHALWPEESEDEHRREVSALLADPSASRAVLLAADDGSGIVGFAELSIRAYAEGCVTDRVGYLEGWYVVPAARRLGIGRRLVAAAEDWARERGCVEFASDTGSGNEVSAAAHRALGFTDVGLVRCFRKELQPRGSRL